MRVFENFIKSPGLSLSASKETDSAVIPHFPKLISNSNRSLSVEKSNPYKLFQKSIKKNFSPDGQEASKRLANSLSSAAFSVLSVPRKFPVGMWSNVTEPFILVDRHSMHNGAVQSFIWSIFIKRYVRLKIPSREGRPIVESDF